MSLKDVSDVYPEDLLLIKFGKKLTTRELDEISGIYAQTCPVCGRYNCEKHTEILIASNGKENTDRITDNEFDRRYSFPEQAVETYEEWKER